MGTRLSWLTPEPAREPEPKPPVDPRVERDRRFRESQAELRRARIARDAACDALRSYRQLKRSYQVSLALCVVGLLTALVSTTLRVDFNPAGLWLVGSIGTLLGTIALVVLRSSAQTEHVEHRPSASSSKRREIRTYRSPVVVLAEAEADYEVAVLGAYLAEELS